MSSVDLETRVANLEKLLMAHMNFNDNKYRENEVEKEDLYNINFSQSTDIADNRAGIEETFESSLTNADDIADVRTALEEVYELITESEV